MSNRYLEKIATDLTKKEQRLLDNGRDRYVNQAALWSTAGGVGTSLYQAGKASKALYEAHSAGLTDSPEAIKDFITSKVPGIGRKVRNATLALGAGGVVLAGNHNYELNKLKKSHPQEYDTALAGSNQKGYIASSLNSGLAGAAMGGLAAPAVAANVAETAYHNYLVSAARKRQIQGYGG